MARSDDRAATTEESGATPPGGKPTSELREFIDRMRGRVDATGKLLGALGTTAATTFGVAKLGDVFPVPDGKELLAVVAVLALLLGTAGVLLVAVRLSRVSRPLLMRTDLAAMKAADEITGREHKLVKPLYDDVARLNGARSLAAYEWRLGSVRRTLPWADDGDERRRRSDLADEISDDIQLTLARGAVIVIRDRATKAVTGWQAWLAYAAVLIGFVGFTLAADSVASARPEERAKLVKTCADLRRAGATKEELGAVSGCSRTADSRSPDEVAAARACGEARAAGATPEELAKTSCSPTSGTVEVVISDADADQPSNATRVRRAVAALRRRILRVLAHPAVGNLLQRAGVAVELVIKG